MMQAFNWMSILTIAMTLGGFVVWGALIVARLRLAAPWRHLCDRTKLDQAYLDHWAADLGVSDLLQRARRESGV